MIDGWTPGVGDPTVLGWVTVAAYFFAAWLAGNAAAHSRKGHHLERLFWLACCILLIALGINKQLDLQELVTYVGRVVAKSHGWYAQRRLYQEEFIAAIAGAAILGAVAMVFVLRRSHRHILLAMVGLIFTAGFVLIRAASFHHVDRFLKSGILGARWNWILELTGIAIVGLAAFRYRRKR